MDGLKDLSCDQVCGVALFGNPMKISPDFTFFVKSLLFARILQRQLLNSLPFRGDKQAFALCCIGFILEARSKILSRIVAQVLRC